jgi:hypothetical protein
MSADTSRSEQVVEDYKKHKLAGCALHRINDLIRGFEAERAIDLRLAQFGSILVLALIGVSAYFLLNNCFNIIWYLK